MIINRKNLEMALFNTIKAAAHEAQSFPPQQRNQVVAELIAGIHGACMGLTELEPDSQELQTISASARAAMLEVERGSH